MDFKYWVRSGDQSSGSTTSPVESRLIIFMATIKGGVICVPLLVTMVWNLTLSPVFTTAEVLSMAICRFVGWDDCDGSARAGAIPKEIKNDAANKILTIATFFFFLRSLIGMPASSRRRGTANKKSTAITSRTKTTGPDG